MTNDNVPSLYNEWSTCGVLRAEFKIEPFYMNVWSTTMSLG